METQEQTKPKQKKKKSLNDFLSKSLADIPKSLSKPFTTGTRRNSDIYLPATTEIQVDLERDVGKVIGNHLDNFNRIFRDQGKTYRFRSKAPSTQQQENSSKHFGVPGTVLTLGSKILSFVEDKTPNELPVKHFITGKLFDLLEMYREDLQYQQTDRNYQDIGRKDVRTLIDQVYGYLELNNLIYGCVTCYDVTYFLWRPKRNTLLISHPIANNSHSPTLLQALYYFVQLVLQDYEKQSRNPMDSEIFFNVIKEMDTDEHISEGSSDSDSNYSSIDKRKKTKFNVSKNKIPKYNLTVDALYAGTVVGYGTTGQVIKLKDSNIVVKHCDSYNNRKGFKMLRNEIIIYEKLSLLNLPYVPHYYGKCEIHGQYFVLLEYIPGKHCDWRMSAELTEKFNFIIRDLNSIGVVHNNLRPSHVLLTLDGDIKLIGFGKANIN